MGQCTSSYTPSLAVAVSANVLVVAFQFFGHVPSGGVSVMDLVTQPVD